MLLKLHIKIQQTLFILVVANLLMNEVSAEQSTIPDSQIHGFIAQGLINVNGSNFVNDDGELSAELTEVGLNGSYQLNSHFRLAGQLVYLNGGNRYGDGFRVDYVFLDWSLHQTEHWQVNLYLGRFKNSHWLYSGTRDVPFIRPSIILPQSVYFDGGRDIDIGAYGGALKISHNSDSMGDFDFNMSSSTINISKEQTKNFLSKQAFGEMSNSYDFQVSLYWQPALSSWRFGLILLDKEFTYEADEQGERFFDSYMTKQRVMANMSFEGESWEFSGVVFRDQNVIDGFYSPSSYKDRVAEGFFIQSRYRINQALTLLARYDRFYADRNDKDGQDLEQKTGGLFPSYFNYQHDRTLGLSYDISDKTRLQFEYHYVEGTARLTPRLLPDFAINNNEHWNLWAIELMYWF